MHAWLLAAGIILLVTTMGTPAAQAHAQLLETSPEAASELDGPPEEITLTFDEPVEPAGQALVVTDGEGVEHELTTEVGPEPGQLRGDLPEDIAPGQQLVSWRITAQDGHLEEGEFGFVVTDAAPEPEEPDTEPAEVAEAEPEVDADVEAAGEPDSDEVGGAPWLIALVVLAVAGVVAVVLLRGRGKSSAEAAE